MGAARRFILFLLVISSCFFCHLAQARTQHHHHRMKKHVNHSIASPPMAEPPSQDSDPPSSSISLPPARPPEPANSAPTLNYTTHVYSPPPQPISDAGYGANSTNSTIVFVSYPAPPPLPHSTKAMVGIQRPTSRLHILFLFHRSNSLLVPTIQTQLAQFLLLLLYHCQSTKGLVGIQPTPLRHLFFHYLRLLLRVLSVGVIQTQLVQLLLLL